MYRIKFTEEAIDNVTRLEKSEPQAYKKLEKFLQELRLHPITGTGHPRQLSGDRAGQWSRSITKEHRLVYQIDGTEVLVLVLSAYGHYDDK